MWILPTADELATQPRWTFFMAWAELVQNSKLVQPIQRLDTAVNVVTVGQMSGLSKKSSDEAPPFRGAHLFHAM